MSYGTNNRGGGYGGRNRTGGHNKFKKGQHVWAAMGKDLPLYPVYIQDVKGKTAHVSWSKGSDVVDADIDVKHLSGEMDELTQLFANDPYAENFARDRVVLLMRRGDAQDADHALQNYIIEMDGDPKMLPPKLVEYAKKKGWM